MANSTKKSRQTTIDQDEITRFSRDARHWWDENGPFAPLHRLNPVRMRYIRNSICRHYGHPHDTSLALKNLKILDIGCGGGLVSEPLARMGATVTGIDADKIAIGVARLHAKESDLAIDYRNETSDTLKGQFDIVLALEIAEHVASVDRLVGDCVDLCKSGGLIIFSTLNRTPKSFALGIIAAEYILRWVPAGTHDWKKFIRPSELARCLKAHGAHPLEVRGLRLNPFKQEFEIVENDMDVNYFMVAEKKR